MRVGVFPAAAAGYGQDSGWIARYFDSDIGAWFDIGDPRADWPEPALLLAESRGHDLEWDPPGLSSGKRWTCRACGRAALDYLGNAYGSAIDGGPCPARDTSALSSGFNPGKEPSS